MLDHLAPARRRLVLSAMALLAAIVVAVALVTTLRVIGDDAAPAPQDELGPVLLVSGYGGSTAALEPLRAELQAMGRTVVVVPPVGDGVVDLAEQAEALDEVAQQAAEEAGASSVDVVGYSAGGVVARLWVRDHGGDELARRVVGLGSPQHGTEVARFVLGGLGSCPVACRQLVPDSDLLRELNAGDETPDGPEFVAIYSNGDQVVTPPESALLEGALGFSVQSVCPRGTASHGELPSDPVVLAALESVLGVDPPAIPEDVACG